MITPNHLGTKRRSTRIALAAAISVAACWSTTPAFADPPLLIHYQGFATDALGTPLVGSETMTFRLCDAAVGGTCHWTETKLVTGITEGVFGTQLGDTAALTLSDFAPAALYLELELGAAPSNETLTPRHRIVSAPYALECSNATMLGGQSVTELSAVVEANALSDNMLSFASGALFFYDAASGQNRFEFSDDVAIAGTLSVGDWTGADVAYSHVGYATTVTGEMDSSEDLFIGSDLEVDSRLFLNFGQLFMKGQSTPGHDADQFIYFYEDDNRAGEAFWWNDAEDRFELSDDLRMPGHVRVTNTFHFGGAADTTDRQGYNAIANSTADVPTSTRIGGSNDLYVSGDVEMGGQLRLTNTFHVGGAADTSDRQGYNAIANDVSNAPVSSFINSSKDLFVAGDVELGDRVRMARTFHAGVGDTTDRSNYNAISNDTNAAPMFPGIDSSADLFVADDLEVGDVLYVEGGRVSTPVLEIRGGADLAERFDVGPSITDGGEVAPEPGTVVCIDPERPGALRVCDRAYDRTAVGIVSGAGQVRPGMLMGQEGSVADGDVPVALTGRVYVRADTSTGPVRPGDLLTTSSRPGHAAAVRDYERSHGAVLGKAMTALEAGDGLVLVLVGLQ